MTSFPSQCPYSKQWLFPTRDKSYPPSNERTFYPDSKLDSESEFMFE